MQSKIAIVKTGTTIAAIKAEHGDFEDWICHAMGIEKKSILFCPVFQGAPLPNRASCKAVIITGSSAMVSEKHTWSEEAAEWLSDFITLQRPVLGICYGHQLLAHALGAEVGTNPKGREIGTIAVQLSAQGKNDPLLGCLEDQFYVQATHRESVLNLPDNTTLLASNPKDPHQSFVYQQHAWGVQFHPEFSAEIVCGYIRARAEQLKNESLDPDALIAAIRQSHSGTILLQRFASIISEMA